jgi:glucose/mannose transport system substrate-binding protein
VHRANAAWVNPPCARRIGGAAPRHIPALSAWLEQARRRIAAPLAVGAEPWQIGVLFESVLLAVAGGTTYRRAFVEQDPAVWAEPQATEAVASFLRLRDFVDDDAMALPWQGQLARVQRGEAAMQVMGDWVRATEGAGLVEWAVPGTAAWFVAVVDFFVPLAHASATLSHPVAAALTAAPFQYAFALAKGCLPAVQDAWGVIDPRRYRGIDVEAMVLPSLTFDQCCGVARKQALLAIVANCFIERRSASVCTLALADLAHGLA